MDSGVYCILCLKSRRRYIGSAQNLTSRKSQHRSGLRRHKHGNWKLQEAYDRYGCMAFLVLERCSPSVLFQREQFYMDLFDSVRNGFNIDRRAGGRAGTKLTSEQRRAQSLRSTGKTRAPYLSSPELRFYGPDGKALTVRNLSEFCKLYRLSEGCMRYVAQGRQTNHKGWRRFSGEIVAEKFVPKKREMAVATRQKLEVSVYSKRRGIDQVGARQAALSVLRSSANPCLKNYAFVAPDGAVIEFRGLAPFCRERGLNYRKMLAVISGERYSHKGWTATAD